MPMKRMPFIYIYIYIYKYKYINIYIYNNLKITKVLMMISFEK